MKRILITGENSYVGNSFEEWVKDNDELCVEKISLRNKNWVEEDFSTYDVVLHVAGIAHVSTDPKQEQLYYKVNRDLTINVAKKAKLEGVKQFIFISSIIVYGEKIEAGIIRRDTPKNPTNFYGKSKLEAEKGILPLQNESFNVVIVRPPMIYGKESKGNYPKLAKIAKVIPIFPDVDNQRSMLHIDNLSAFIKSLILREDKGLFFPQNSEYVKTSELVKMIGAVHGKNVRLTKIFNPILNIFINRINVLNKLFGNLVYDKSLSKNEITCDLKESIKRTESV